MGKDSALLSSRDAGLLEPPERPQGSPASSSVWSSPMATAEFSKFAGILSANDKYRKDRIYRREATKAENEMVLEQVLLSVGCASKPTAGLELA